MVLKPLFIRQRRFPLMVIALFILVVFSCAKQGFPPGGPVDNIPPELKNSSPAINAVNVPLNSPVEIEFSEAMDEKSVEDNIFIVPIPLKWPSFEWRSGSSILKIKMAEPFKDSTTYVITIGAKTQDRHRNGLKDSIILCFSTGSVVENKKLTGKVIPFNFFNEKREKISEIDVVAYRLVEGKEPDPSNDVPAYFTQTGLDGTYEMSGLSKGIYRVFAIADNDRDGFYTPDSDLIGIMPRDVEISEKDSLFYAPDIMVSLRQNTDFSLVTVRAADGRRVEFPFDRPVNPDSFAVKIDGIDVLGFYRDVKNPKIISVATGVQEAKKKYSILSLKAVDEDGNTFNVNEPKYFFTGSDKPDTTTLEIIEWGPKVLINETEEISLKFNRALNLEKSIAGFIKQESGDSVSVALREANELILKPVEKWQRGFNYIIQFDTENIKGMSGNKLDEKKSQISFRAAPVDSFCPVGGRIDDNNRKNKSLYRIVYKNLETGYIYNLNISEPGAWKSNDLLPGSYLFFAHKDENGDGKVYPGKHYPFEPSEQVCAIKDTVKVALRWQIDNINFTFK